MSAFNLHELAILDAHLGASASLLGATLQLGLSSTTPNDDGSNITEPTGANYARVSITNDGTSFDPATLVSDVATKVNKNEILFNAASGGDWGTITHWVLYESSIPKLWGMLDDGAGIPTPRTITDGDQFRFLAEQLRITLD